MLEILSEYEVLAHSCLIFDLSFSQFALIAHFLGYTFLQLCLLVVCPLIFLNERDIGEVFLSFGVAGRRQRVRNRAERDRFHLYFSLQVFWFLHVTSVPSLLVDGVPSRARAHLFLKI